MKKKFSSIFYLSFLVIYLEVLTKIFITKSFNGIFLTLLFSIPLILILYLLGNIFKNKGNKVMKYDLLVIILDRAVELQIVIIISWDITITFTYFTNYIFILHYQSK